MTTSPSHAAPVIVLITVNKIETHALLDAFLGAGRIPAQSAKGGLTYNELGLHGGNRVVHTVCKMGAGGVGAAQQRAAQAIAHWQPRAIIGVGIAFGMDETRQAIGDVLVSAQIQDYELGRVNADGTLTPRGDKAGSADNLLNRLDLTDTIEERRGEGWPKVEFGLMLTGQKLLDNLDYRESLKTLFPQAIGGEMEGVGLHATAHAAKVDWLVVKAISDWGHGENQEKRDAWQKQAASNAARVLKTALAGGGLYDENLPTRAAAMPEAGAVLHERYIDDGTENEKHHAPIQATLRERANSGAKSMAFHRLALQHFRCFDQIDISFESDLTVIVAENGQGKTAILDACRIALWQFVGCFDLAASDSGSQFEICPDDVQLRKMPSGDLMRQLPVVVSMRGHVGNDKDIVWSQRRTSEAKGSQNSGDIGAEWLAAWAKLLQSQMRDPEQPPLTLPVFAYYGTGRLWAQQSIQRSLNQADGAKPDDDVYIRTFAYRDCLEPASSYQHFAEWFTWICKSQFSFERKQAQKGLPLDATSPWRDKIVAVQQATDSLLKTTGWHSLAYSEGDENSLVLENDRQVVLKVAQLSDGIRNMLALVGDLAYRCVKLNPHLGSRAAQEASGVVLIDEIDMHLHPGWQQRVVLQMQEAFPKIQFIVTTHSDQVLSSVHARCIRVLRQRGLEDASTEAVEQVSEETRGVTSPNLLARVMGVDQVPDVPEARLLSQYRELIQLNLHGSPEGLALAAKLNTHFGADHPVMQECASMARVEAFKRSLANGNPVPAAQKRSAGDA